MATLLLVFMVSLTPAERDSILAETQGNEAFWTEILGSSSGEVLEAVEYLLTTIPRLDRLEMTEEALMDHVMGALETRSAFYDSLPDSIFMPCLVQYRIDEEPVTPYRTALALYWAVRLDPEDRDPLSVAAEIAGQLDAGMQRFEYDYLGGIGDPVSTLGAGGGSDRETRVLLCASLKSLGIASRSVQGWFSGRHGGGRRWIEVWDGGAWVPLVTPSDSVPDAWEGLSLAVLPTEEEYVTGEYAPTATLTTLPLVDGAGDWAATLSIPIGGRLLPLDWIWFDTANPDTIDVGAGPYFLSVTFRRPSGAVDMWLHQFEAEPGDTLVLDLSRALYHIIPLPGGGTP